MLQSPFSLVEVATAIAALTPILVTVSKIHDARRGKRLDAERKAQAGIVTSEITENFSRLTQTFERRFDTVDQRFDRVDGRLDTVELKVAEVRAFAVGPDGDNGIRGDVRKVETRVDDIEKRERERLERIIGTTDRRAAL